MSDLISKRTRQEFREYFVGTSLRIIGDAFDAEDVHRDRNYNPPEGGARRSFVEQYYHSVDWRNPSDVGRVLRVFASVLMDLEQATTEGAQRTRSRLLGHLQRDGIHLQDGRLALSTSSVHTGHTRSVAIRLNLPGAPAASRPYRGIHRYRPRPCDRDSEGDDRDHMQVDLDRSGRILFEECRCFGSGEADTQGAEAPARGCARCCPRGGHNPAALESARSVARNVAELRSLYGTGHGKEGKARGLQPRHARLVVGSAATLATFLLETHENQLAESSREARRISKDA